ncbi:MAG: hypothetical protein ACKVN9_03015 [Methylophilaceae bacterium]
MLRILCALLLVVLTSRAQAECRGAAKDHKKDFLKALAHLKALKEYKTFEKELLAVGLKVVVFEDAWATSKTLINDRCYWSINVYEDHPDHVHRWNEFYVRSDGKHILVDDMTGENPPMTLKQWRAQNKKWEQERKKQQKEVPQIIIPKPDIQESSEVGLETQEM